MRVFAYIARRYNSAAESTSLLISVASLAITIPRDEYYTIRACFTWLTFSFCFIVFDYSRWKTSFASAVGTQLINNPLKKT